MSLIQIRALTKAYQLGNTAVSALRGIDLDIQESEFLSVVGPSGSGKTTLLNIIGAIDTASSGSIKLDGQELTTMKDKELTSLRLHKVGFIFQSFNLIPVLDVTENVEFPLLLMPGLTKAEIKKRVDQVVDEVGLREYVHHRPAELSGGQRQRVAIARALVTRPKLVLADEPTANLDSATGEAILELMKELNRTEKTTFLFSTHDPQVLEYAQRVVRIRDGLLVGDEHVLA